MVRMWQKRFLINVRYAARYMRVRAFMETGHVQIRFMTEAMAGIAATEWAMAMEPEWGIMDMGDMADKQKKRGNKL